jgi:LPS export ABC transporter protein LptC
VTRGWLAGGCMLLMAAALSACGEETVRPPLTSTAADSADQVLEGMEHFITNDGVRRTRVLADTAYLYEATQLARLKKVRVTFYDATGAETSTVVGDSGLYQTRDGSMNAWGKVVATTPDGRVLKSEELKYDSRRQKISSNLPFTYDRPGERMTGKSFISDPDFKNIQAVQPTGGQTGTPGDSSSGGFLLPGQ